MVNAIDIIRCIPPKGVRRLGGRGVEMGTRLIFQIFCILSPGMFGVWIRFAICLPPPLILISEYAPFPPDPGPESAIFCLKRQQPEMS